MNRRSEALVAWLERGQAVVWVVVMLPLFLSVIGLAADGALVFSARRELQDIADAAARAGATAVDEEHYRRTGEVQLDQARARQAVEAAIGRADSRRLDGRPQARVEPGRTAVLVWLRARVPLAFMRIVGLRTTEISLMATGAPKEGIVGDEYWRGRGGRP